MLTNSSWGTCTPIHMETQTQLTGSVKLMEECRPFSEGGDVTLLTAVHPPKVGDGEVVKAEAIETIPPEPKSMAGDGDCAPRNNNLATTRLNQSRLKKHQFPRAHQFLHKDNKGGDGKSETPHTDKGPMKKLGGGSVGWRSPVGKQVAANRRAVTPAKALALPQGYSAIKFKYQIKRFLQSIDEYRKLETSIKFMQENLCALKADMLNAGEADPGEIPVVHSTIQEIIQETYKEPRAEEDRKKCIELEKEVTALKESLQSVSEEKGKLEDNLHTLSQILREKEDELARREMAEEEVKKINCQMNNNGDEVEVLKSIINQLNQEKIKLMEELRISKEKNTASGDVGSSISDQNTKIRSLESLIENLHISVKALKDQLKVEKETRGKLELENEQLNQENNDLKKMSSPSEYKDVLLEKDAKIKDLQMRLAEISKVRQYRPSEDEEKIIRVDYSGDTQSLVTQLAKFVQLYEEIARESMDMEAKLKDSHMEVYRLEQILQKQLEKIKEQDSCLKKMEVQMSAFVTELKKSKINMNQCKCNELEAQMKEKDEQGDKMKEKIGILYQKYKQYKVECAVMKKRLDSFEKRGWLKKLIKM